MHPVIISIRVLKLLTEQLNSSIKHTLISGLFISVVSQIIGFWMLIGGPIVAKIPIPLVLFFAVAAMEGMVIILVVYNFAADVNRMSNQMHVKLNANKNVLRNKYFTKFLKSSQKLSVRLGISNFLEKTTPLEVKKFCTDRVVDLLLVGKNDKLNILKYPGIRYLS